MTRLIYISFRLVHQVYKTRKHSLECVHFSLEFESYTARLTINPSVYVYACASEPASKSTSTCIFSPSVLLLRSFAVTYMACADPKSFLSGGGGGGGGGGHLQTRGGPTNFTIAKTHNLENRGGGTGPSIPLWIRPCMEIDLWIQVTFNEKETYYMNLLYEDVIIVYIFAS